MSILIAEDDASMRHLLKKILHGAGYEVVEVDNGRSALACLSSASGPRLALLDWLMPECDGLSVCREIRKLSEHPYVYIVLLSARTSKKDIVAGLESGADDYLTKPCNPDELKARLRAGERILNLEDKLVHNTFHDPLTQLPNRRFFLDLLSRCVARGSRRPDHKFAVLLMDIDHFKVVNDSVGSAAGDSLIIQIAKRLVGSIRQEDTVARADIRALNQPDADGTLARLGGDEFIILLEHIRDAGEGIRVAERVQNSIQAPFLIDGREVFITASIGIAFSASGYSAAEDMLGDAYTAVTRAKSLGGSRYEVCDPAMHANAVNRFSLEADLRRATERGEFRLYYQPIVALADSRIAGFEALIRWYRPELGLVMPSEFISVAEDSNLIVTIGAWALREACRQMRAWNQQFPSDPGFTVAVNISARQFAQPDLVGGIAQILRETGLAPECLKLELTEGVTMRDEERTTRIMRELKMLGVRLCIDDFGTGYSSLSYLRRFSLDTLKIDRSFVCEIVNNGESREIVKTILSLGINLGMEVVAEGVETADQVSLLKSCGCQYAQGYFFSGPMDQWAAERALLALAASHYTLLPEVFEPWPASFVERRRVNGP